MCVHPSAFFQIAATPTVVGFWPVLIQTVCVSAQKVIELFLEFFINCPHLCILQSFLCLATVHACVMLVKRVDCLSQAYPQFQDFIVVHDYLVTPSQKQQARVRRRGQNGNLKVLLAVLFLTRAVHFGGLDAVSRLVACVEGWQHCFR